MGMRCFLEVGSVQLEPLWEGTGALAGKLRGIVSVIDAMPPEMVKYCQGFSDIKYQD